MHVALALSMLCFLKESSAVGGILRTTGTWYPLDNREYYVAIEASRSINFNESRHACVRLNASLAKVNTSAIQDLVANHTVAKKGFYIGLMRTSFNGTFQWLDGTPLAYSHWFNREPNNGGRRQGDERCTAIGFHWRNSSMWNDLNCKIKLGGYICQRTIEIPTTLSPTTFNNQTSAAITTPKSEAVQLPIIIAAAVGGLLFLGLIVFLILLRCRRKKDKPSSMREGLTDQPEVIYNTADPSAGDARSENQYSTIGVSNSQDPPRTNPRIDEGYSSLETVRPGAPPYEPNAQYCLINVSQKPQGPGQDAVYSVLNNETQKPNEKEIVNNPLYGETIRSVEKETVVNPLYASSNQAQQSAPEELYSQVKQ